jgi:hypothetical protein
VRRCIIIRESKESTRALTVNSSLLSLRGQREKEEEEAEGERFSPNPPSHVLSHKLEAFSSSSDAK